MYCLNKLLFIAALISILSLNIQAQDVYKGRSKAKAVRIAKKPAFPANIQVSHRSFKDTNGDGVLEAEESGKIIIQLENRSGYNGDVEIKITPLTPVEHLTFKTNTKVGILKGGEKRKVEIPVKAGFDVTTDTRELRVDVTEKYYRFDATPIRIKFPTQAFEAPKFKIVLREIKDEKSGNFSLNNNNGQIDKQETIETVVAVQNIGGDAENVRVQVKLKGTETNNIHYRTISGGVENSFKLGKMKYGKDRDVNFVFFTNSFYGRETVDFDIAVSERRGKYGTSKSFSLPIAGFVKTEDVLVVTSQIRERARLNEVKSGQVEVEKLPTNSKSKLPNGFAIVVGIEDYRYAPSAEWKVRDAQYFYEYANKVLGIPDENIKRPLFNEEATKAELDYIFASKSSASEGWLKRRIGDPQVAKKSDIFVYLGGHGYADTRTKEPYFIPYDVRPEQATNGISLNKLYASLDEFGAKSVTVFVESCFSGLTGYTKTSGRKPDKLIKGQNPIGIKVNPSANLTKTIVFTAASGIQASNNSDQLKHGIFTYYLLSGLQGKADLDNNKKITVKELWKFLDKNVPLSAQRLLDRTQRPSLLPGLKLLNKKAERVLVKY